MTLRRLLLRGLVPLSVFAVLATLVIVHGIGRASEEQVSQGTPAVVRDQAVPVTPETEREPAPPRKVDDDHKVEDHDDNVDVGVSDTVVAQLPATELAEFSLLGVTWRGGLSDAETVVEVRWRDKNGWSDWTELHVDPSDEGNPGTEPYWVGSADAAAVRVLSTSDADPRGLQLATIDPGKMPTFTEAAAVRAAASAVSQPTIISRAAWGASNSGTCDSPVYGSSLRGAVIHHTAGSNTEPQSRSAAVVKATQAYHVNSRDWCDIGYNFLVDRFGQIFEGRRGGIDKVVRGAHSGNGPVNEQTTGISLMGTFTSTSPTAAMKDAVVRITAWKLALHGVSAEGTYSLGGKNLNRISGHRNVVSTACPGTKVYDWLGVAGGLRDQVAQAMVDGDVEIPSTVQNISVGSVTSSSATVSWDAVPTAVKYRVYVSKSSSMPGSCAPNCEVITPSELTDPSHVLSGLVAGQKYYVKVSAINGANKTITGWQATPTSFTTGAPAPSVNDTVTVPSGRTIEVKGHGYGHGIGMSQYGAEGGAQQGQKFDTILAKYYPSTDVASRSGTIRVLLTGQVWDSTTVIARSGLSVRQPVNGSPIALPTSIGGAAVDRWTIEPLSSDRTRNVLRHRTASGWTTYRTFSGDGQFESSSPIELVTAAGNKKYRDALRSTSPKSGATNRDTVNVLGIEDYVRGVVAREMPSSWHPEALKAQSVAARTYGVRDIGSGYYDICDTTSCQVYGGVASETSATDAAIKATAGKILTYDGQPAFTQFSSSSGGYTNKGSQAYLKPVSDPWDGWSGNKNHAWTLTVKASTIEGKHPSIGTLKSIQVATRNGFGEMGGRVTSVKLVGSKASKTISGVDARWDFGLKSDWFGF